MASQTEIRARVTARIVAALQAGTPPWRRSWSGQVNIGTPANAVYHFGSSDADADHWLVLDRQARLLFVLPVREARPFLRRQWPQAEPAPLSQKDLEVIWATFRRQMEARPMPTCEEITAAMRRQRQIESELVRWLDQTLATRLGERS